MKNFLSHVAVPAQAICRRFLNACANDFLAIFNRCLASLEFTSSAASIAILICSCWVIPPAFAETVTFSSSGTYTISPGITHLLVTVTGGGGGKGGDDQRQGGVGGRGAIVSGLITVNAGEVFNLYVGNIGSDGLGANCSGGGAGGTGWQNGGLGGNAGCVGMTGAGGGGGGASAFLRSGMLMLAAGGGGGGNGGQEGTNGLAGLDAGTASGGFGTPGGTGGSFSGGASTVFNDGSGGGGSGGGCIGGAGGVAYGSISTPQLVSGSAGTSCASDTVIKLTYATATGVAAKGQIVVTAFPPTVSIATIANSGTGVFGYNLTGVAGSTENINVTTPGIAATGNIHLGTRDAITTITQTTAPSGWPLNPTSVSCRDSNAGISGNSAGNIASLTANVATLRANVMVDGAVINCVFTNTLAAKTSLTKSGPATAVAGTSVVYALDITNTGLVAGGTELVIKDRLPDGVIATGVTAGTGVNTVNCGALPSAPGALLTCTMTLPSGIAPGAKRGFTLAATMPFVAQGTLLTNYAIANATGSGSPVYAPGATCTTNATINCASAATIVNLASPSVGMGFSPTSIGPYGAIYSTLTITLTNPNSVPALGANFVHGYPTNILNSDNFSGSTTCAGGVVTTQDLGSAFVHTGGSVTLSGGSVPAKGSCTVTVDITSTFLGNYTNTIAAGTVRYSNMASNAAGASAAIEVAESPYTLPVAQTISCSSSGKIFNTAYNTDTAAKPVGSIDSHWIVGVGTKTGPSSVTAWKPAYVVFPKVAIGIWAPTFSNARFISGKSDASHIGTHVYYRYDFNLSSSIDPARFVLALDFYADDMVKAVYANETINSFSGNGVYSPRSMGVANVSSGWRTGSNSLVVYVEDTSNLTSLSAQTRTNTLCSPSVVTIRTISNGVAGVFTYSGTNGFIGQTMTTVTSGVAVSGVPGALAAPDAITTITQVAPPGITLTSASCTGMGVGGTAVQGADGSLLLDAAAVSSNRSIVCTFINTFQTGVTGRVFNDIGSNGGVANDGVINGAETGVAGVSLVLNDCGATVHASASTDDGGNYNLPVPAGLAAGASLCVETVRQPSRTSTGGSAGATVLPAGVVGIVSGVGYTYSHGVTHDRIAFAWPGAGAAAVPTLNFGSVPLSTLGQGEIKAGPPGGTVNYGHIFIAGTVGKVSFSLPGSVSTPTLNGWIERVYADTACTGRLQPGAALLYPPALPLAVTPGQVVCVVLQQLIPPQAPPSSRNQIRLQAGFTFTNASPALSADYVLDDVTTVSIQALDLLKEVRNVTRGATAFSMSNQAKPGEILQYRISYSNISASPITNLVINDTTPNFTTFVSASAGVTPSGLTACSKTDPANAAPVSCATLRGAGGTGPIKWTFTGSLAPGGFGTVLFDATVD